MAATYSPTMRSTIGVAELGVGVCCCGAVCRGARSAQPLPQGVWGARMTISGRTMRQAWNVVGHGGHSYRGTDTWMADTDPYMGAGRTIHVSQARQQSVSAGETEDGAGGMAGTGRMAQLISGRVIHYYYACGWAGGGAHRRRHARARRVARTVKARHGLVWRSVLCTVRHTDTKDCRGRAWKDWLIEGRL